MNYPGWLFWLWAASAAANAVLVSTIVWSRCARAWPSLLGAAVTEILSFCLLQDQSYQRYYVIWFAGAGIQAVLRLTVLHDIWCAIPAISLMPGWLKVAIGAASTAAGIFVLYLLATSFRGGMPDLGLRNNLLQLDGATKFAWGAFALFLLYGIASAGFLMTLTGIRVATGYIVRMLVGMGTAVMYSRHPSISTIFKLAGVDTAAGLWFALYCAFAIINNPTSLELTPKQAEQLDDLFSNESTISL